MRTPTIATACATLALALVPAAARADDPATLAIDGNGVAFVTPDVATLSISVRSEAATRQRARRHANERTQRVLAAIAANGVPRDKVTTTGVTLSRSQTRKHHTVYDAANSIDVRVLDVAKVGPIIDAATRAGADAIDGPDFSFSDPSAGRAQATRAALADARRRADDAAAAVGEKVTGVRSIVIDPADAPEPVAAGALSKSASPATTDAAPTQVSPGRQEVDATVEVVYAIAPA
ncbi:MAG TPA: SIMPL domain-containing protein [Solirubrobacteraceae bacterium]|jgi:uncharacterized protein